VAQRPSVRWNEGKQRWMAWVRFPDGSRRKVERVEKADAERDLNELLARRAEEAAPDPRRLRLATFNDVMDDWFDAGCPKAAVSKNSRHARTKSENTIATARYLLDGHVRPVIGGLRVDRTRTERVERVFQRMDGDGYATSTIDHAWSYLNQACQHAVRRRKIKINPAADVLLPEARPPRQRKSLTVEQVRTLLTVAIRQDRRPALWLTGLMCGPRPGELTGLRWPLVDIDSDDPHILFDERANEVNKRYVGQADPKTSRKGAIGLHPLVIAALRRHRTEMTMLGLYDPEGFVFPTRNGTAISVSNLRRAFRRLLDRAGLPGQDWTTYELRHTFVSVVSDQRGLPPRHPRDAPPRRQRMEQPAQPTPRPRRRCVVSGGQDVRHLGPDRVVDPRGHPADAVGPRMAGTTRALVGERPGRDRQEPLRRGAGPPRDRPGPPCGVYNAEPTRCAGAPPPH
jgi:integrase